MRKSRATVIQELSVRILTTPVEKRALRSILIAKLKELMTQQLAAENRADRKAA